MAAARKKANDSDAWVSLVEASRLLGESRLMILNRTVKGEIDAKHIAKRTVVSRESIERVLASRVS